MTWNDLFLDLQASNLDVYATGQKLGNCLSPYVVIKSNTGGKFGNFSTTTEVYDFMCYHPDRSQLDGFVNSVRELVKELRNKYMIRDINNVTSEFYDDQVKGYMRSFQFIVYRKEI